MSVRDAIAIEIGRRRVRAVQAARNGGGDRALRVHRVMIEDVPDGLDREDAAAFGAWIGGRLAAAGIPRGRATVAIARDDVGLKRLTLPTVDADELPGMTRIALRRELPFDADSAVIDYVPVERTATHTTVLAVAAPEQVVERTRAIAEAAGLDVERIGLRAMGSAALLNHMSGAAGASGEADDACVLAVDVTGIGVEFCLVDHGAVRFSRAAALGAADGNDAAAVVTEARRTWLSYRIVDGASDVTQVTLMGDARVTREAAQPIGEILEATSSVLDRHPLVESNGATMDGVWPLAGLLLESVLGLETIDFANPHEPVDRAAVWRKRGIMAAGVLVVVMLAMFTLARKEMSGLRGELASLTVQQRELVPDAQRYQRDTWTLAHLKRWERADVDWLDHLVGLHRLVPAPDTTVLDAWTGSLDFRGVVYDKRAEKWSVPRRIGIILDGEARDRQAADALREAIVDSAWYELTSSGADAPGGRRLPHGFTYRLATDLDAPPEPSDGGEATE